MYEYKWNLWGNTRAVWYGLGTTTRQLDICFAGHNLWWKPLGQLHSCGDEVQQQQDRAQQRRRKYLSIFELYGIDANCLKFRHSNFCYPNILMLSLIIYRRLEKQFADALHGLASHTLADDSCQKFRASHITIMHHHIYSQGWDVKCMSQSH